MATSPRPTEAQLRQHALDRAVTDGMTALVIASYRAQGRQEFTAEDAARTVTQVADVFVEYLRGPKLSPEDMAQSIHTQYESMAVKLGLRPDSESTPWDKLPAEVQHCMVRTAQELMLIWGLS